MSTSHRSSLETTHFCPHIAALSTRVSPTSVPLAHCHIALRFYAKLTPLALLHCQLTHAPWKWFFLQQPASLPALEGHLSPLLSWKRQREKVDWLEKNNRELRKLSGRERGSLPSDSRSESSSSRNSCSRGRQSRAERSARTPFIHAGDETLVYHTINTQILQSGNCKIWLITHV